MNDNLKMHGIYVRHFLLLVSLVPLSALGVWNKYFVINSNNWRFTNVSRQEKYLQKLDCLTLCDHTIGCATVNHNSVTKSCELLKAGPWIPTPVSQTESNWIVFYKGDQHIDAVNVWQSSTFVSNNIPTLLHSAYLAIDGNRNNTVWEKCAHTDDYQSFWAVEFDHVVEVSHVIVFFMNSDFYNYRNSDLRLMISDTRQDSDNNNNGTDCATYIGPPASSLPPVKITCTQPVTGKFLKIIQKRAHHLPLCEVEVFTS